MNTYTINRTLVGANGAKLINHPGIIFPKNVLAPAPRQTIRDHIKKEIPENGITTAEVAQIMHCSTSGARQYLHRHRIKFILALTKPRTLISYWDKSEVLSLLSSREPFTHKKITGHYSTAKTLDILGVARSALYRLTKKGELKEIKVRELTPKGIRVRSYYSAESVRRLCKHPDILPSPKRGYFERCERPKQIVTLHPHTTRLIHHR